MKNKNNTYFSVLNLSEEEINQVSQKTNLTLEFIYQEMRIGNHLLKKHSSGEYDLFCICNADWKEVTFQEYFIK